MLAKRHGFRTKLIVGVMMAPPKWFLDAHPEARIVDEKGRYSTNTMSYWYPGLHRLIEEKSRRLLQSLREMDVLGLVDYLIPSFGPAGEPVYPVPWTLGPGFEKQTYWCYDPAAQADFRMQMRRRHRTLGVANTRWGTSFDSWQAVRVLPPETRPGPYWDDVLTWYRDSKRSFIRWQIDSLRRQSPRGARVLVYVPGTAYSDADWQEAVRTARGGDWIMMMADSRFLIDLAAGTRCWLQYTGCENAPEVTRLRRYIDAQHHAGLELWGENAGYWEAARDPLNLARIIVENRLYGLDLTHGHFLFQRDGITPNEAMPKLKEAFAQIRAAHAR
jgi:hypothetical protein